MQKMVDISGIKNLAEETTAYHFANGRWRQQTDYVPVEVELTIYVNKKALVTILCTPNKLNCLVVGYLYAEGIISGLSDVASIRVCDSETTADVMLTNPEFQLPTVRTLASGCGSSAGIFKTQAHRVDSGLVIAPGDVLSLMKQFQEQMLLYKLSGGVHTAAIADTKNLMVIAEDIGRHNALNKVQGEALLKEKPTKDSLVLVTGRISSEMLLKVARMEAPIVISRRSPTAKAISLARDLGITLVGAVRSGGFTAYSFPERVGLSAKT